MNTTIRRNAGVVLLVFSVACGSSEPTSPSGPRQPSSLPSPTPSRLPISFPPLSGPSRTFIFDGELSYPVRDFTRESRFILYDNGAFGLQYPGLEYVFRGGYQDANGVLMFLFDSSTGRNVDEPWDDATGTLKGNLLTVQYDETMRHSDFEDAVYVLMP
jgi:hypothetical protein